MGIWNQESRFSAASGEALPYVVMQVTLKEKFFGTGSGNLTDLEAVINDQVAQGIPSAYDVDLQRRQQGLRRRRPDSGDLGF